MTTSGTINTQFTARQIINKALGEIGVAALGVAPDAAVAQDALERLDWILKSMQADGANIWRQEEDSVAVSAGSKTITLSPRTIDVIEGRWLYSSPNGFQMSLARWDQGQYITLPNKDATGTPTCFWPYKGRDSYTVTFWMVPSTDSTFYYTSARVIEDVTGLDQTLDLPQEWTQCAWMALADNLAGPNGIIESAPRTAARVSQVASSLYQKLLDADRPSVVQMKPWNRTW